MRNEDLFNKVNNSTPIFSRVDDFTCNFEDINRPEDRQEEEEKKFSSDQPDRVLEEESNR